MPDQDITKSCTYIAVHTSVSVEIDMVILMSLDVARLTRFFSSVSVILAFVHGTLDSKAVVTLTGL